MTTITPIRTGEVRIRPSLRSGGMNKSLWRRCLDILTDRDWTQPLPIYTYLIEHEEGLILFDCGETSRTGFFPWCHPNFRVAVDLRVAPHEEIGPQLRARGIDPARDLNMLVISHLHHDHTDGLEHFRGTPIVVSRENYEVTQGIPGALIGAVPSRWPTWFDPTVRDFDGPAVGGFVGSIRMTSDGSVFGVPTPGHMPGHLSLVVRTPGLTYFLAGDATYDQDLLRQRIVDGQARDVAVSISTLDRIAAFAAAEPTVLLPAHDPAAEQRLAEQILLAA